MRSAAGCALHCGDVDGLRKIGAGRARTQRSTDLGGAVAASGQSVVAKEAQGGSAKQAETFTKDGKMLYGVTIAKNGTEEELLISETGEIVGRQAPGEEDDHD